MDILSGDIQALFAQGRTVRVKTHAGMAEVEWGKKEFFEFLCKLVDSDSQCSYGIKKYFSFVLE